MTDHPTTAQTGAELQRQAALAIEQGDWLGAATALLRVVELEPGNEDVHLAAAAVLLEAGGAQEALQLLEIFAARFSTSPRLVHAAGLALFRLGQHGAAETLFARTRELGPDHPTAAEDQAEAARARAEKGEGAPLPPVFQALVSPPEPPSFVAPAWQDLGQLQLERGPDGLLEINGVKGFLMNGDVIMLVKLAASLPRGGTYVEIGSFMGLSSILVASTLVASGNTDARFYCVDTWEGSIEHQELSVIREKQLYHVFCDNVQKAGVAPYLRPVREPSMGAARYFAAESVDLLFVDGDHSFEGCYGDLVAWWPTVKRGGRVLGHDCVPGDGVHQAIQKFSAEHGLSFTIHEPPAAHYVFELHGGKLAG